MKKGEVNRGKSSIRGKLGKKMGKKKTEGPKPDQP